MARRSRHDPVPNERPVNFCFPCGKTFRGTRACFNHNWAKHNFKTMDCGTCGTAFSTNILVEEHHQRFHVDNAHTGIRCQTCGTFSENGNQNCRTCGKLLPAGKILINFFLCFLSLWFSCFVFVFVIVFIYFFLKCSKFYRKLEQGKDDHGATETFTFSFFTWFLVLPGAILCQLNLRQCSEYFQTLIL